MSSCALHTDLGLVRDVLLTVDCNTRGFAQAGYESLTLAGSPFQTALTLFLTLYVAVSGYRLFFATGGARLSDGPGIVLKIGAILTLVTNWSVFQTLVFDLAARAPVEIARTITLPLRDGNTLAADPINGLSAAYDQLSAAADAFAKAKTVTGASGASETVKLASENLFAASVGVVSLLTIAIGILTAIGPVFVALFLFVQTRGFFAGWVRALAAAGFGLFGTWTLTVLLLRALSPWLAALSQTNAAGVPDVQAGLTTAVIVFVFAAAEAGLLLAGFIIARGFRLPARNAVRETSPGREIAAITGPSLLVSRPVRLAEQLQSHSQAHALISRAGSVAASVTRGPRTEAVWGAPHLGDLYRRPAPARHDRRRDA